MSTTQAQKQLNAVRYQLAVCRNNVARGRLKFHERRLVEIIYGTQRAEALLVVTL